MGRLALALGFAAVVAAGLPSPGLYLALGLGIGAIGLGWAAFGRRGGPGFARLAAAAAITVGAIAVVLGGLRIVLVLAALGHLDNLIQ